MFSETLLDHARYPQNGGAMESPDAVGRADLGGHPPSTSIFLRVQETTVIAATFETFGCGVSVAACSVLTQLVKGKTFQDCLAVTADQIAGQLEGVPPPRRFCLDLAVAALRNAIALALKRSET